MKKLILGLFAALILVGCAGDSKPGPRLACAVADTEQSSIMSYNLKNDKVSSLRLEMTVKNSVFEETSEEGIKAELQKQFSKDLTMTMSGDVVSFSTSISSDDIEVLKAYNIPFDQEASESSDLEAITKFYEDLGGTCNRIEE